MFVLWVILIYYTIAVAYLFLLSIAGIFKFAGISQQYDQPINRQLILVPAYREDAVILSTVKNILSQNYPKGSYDILVIADSLQQKTLLDLKKLQVRLLEVTFESSTKSKSLNAAFLSLQNETIYDIVSIIDADNFLESDYLAKVNRAYNAGFKAIQCRRVAKNINNSYSILDALSEIINNHIYRKGPQNLGLSCSLIGSGMAFDFKLAKATMQKVDAIGGFDRMLQLLLVEEGIKILYLEDARVFDEKVEKGIQFESQRKRWIASQYYYLRKYFKRSFQMLFRGNVDYFHMGFIQNFFLPKYLNFGGLVLTTCIMILVSMSSIFTSYLLLLTLLHILVFLIPIPRKFYNMSFVKAILYLPVTFFYMVRSFFQMKGANRKFIHTEHNTVEIDHDLFEKH